MLTPWGRARGLYNGPVPINAEGAYLFRHSVVRDAAYQLQLPSDRATLHALALEVLDGLFGRENLGSLVFELVEHARLALSHPGELGIQRCREISDLEEQLLVLAAQEAKQLNLHAQAVGYLERLLEKTTSAQRRVLAFTKLSDAFNKLGALPRSEESARSAVALARSEGLHQLLPGAMFTLGGALLAESRNDAATRVFDEALTLARTERDQNVEGAALGFLAVSAWRRGHIDLAESHFSNALAVLHAGNDRSLLARHLGNYGLMKAECGHHARALEIYSEALELQREVGNDWSAAVVLFNMSTSQDLVGLTRPAREGLRAARSLATRIGHVRLLGAIQGRAAAFAADDGEFNEALRCYAEAGQTAHDLHDPVTEWVLRSSYGSLLDALGFADEAERELRLSISMAMGAKTPLEVAGCKANLAGMLVAQGRFHEALVQVGEAAELARGPSQDERAAVVLGLHKASALLGLGNLAEAVSLLDDMERRHPPESEMGGLIPLSRARFALLLGRVEVCKACLAQVARDITAVRLISEPEALVRLRLAVSCGQHEHAKAAVIELENAKPSVAEWPKARHNQRIQTGRRLLAELERHGQGGLWWGHFPQELGSDLRKAILQQMQTKSPELISQCEPGLLAAMAEP